MSVRTSFTALITLAVSLLAGCATLQIKSGREVSPSALGSLQVGSSSAMEVEAVLGKPEGKGRELFPFAGEARSVWSYFFEADQMAGGGVEAHRIYLLVFLKDGRYDGYLWFSSRPADRPTSAVAPADRVAPPLLGSARDGSRN